MQWFAHHFRHARLWSARPHRPRRRRLSAGSAIRARYRAISWRARVPERSAADCRSIGRRTAASACPAREALDPVRRIRPVHSQGPQRFPRGAADRHDPHRSPGRSRRCRASPVPASERTAVTDGLREPHGEDAAFAGPAPDVDRAVMAADDLADRCKTEPISPFVRVVKKGLEQGAPEPGLRYRGRCRAQRRKRNDQVRRSRGSGAGSPRSYQSSSLR